MSQELSMLVPAASTNTQVPSAKGGTNANSPENKGFGEVLSGQMGAADSKATTSTSTVKESNTSESVVSAEAGQSLPQDGSDLPQESEKAISLEVNSIPAKPEKPVEGVAEGIESVDEQSADLVLAAAPVTQEVVDLPVETGTQEGADSTNSDKPSAAPVNTFSPSAQAAPGVVANTNVAEAHAVPSQPSVVATAVSEAIHQESAKPQTERAAEVSTVASGEIQKQVEGQAKPVVTTAVVADKSTPAGQVAMTHGHNVAQSTQAQTPPLQGQADQSAADVKTPVAAERVAADQQVAANQPAKGVQYDQLMSAIAAIKSSSHVDKRGGDQAVSTLENIVANRPSGESAGLATGLTSTTAANASSPLSTAATANPNGSVASQALNLPVQHHKWGESMAERVVWMLKNHAQQAEIKLNPANLGPLDIKLSISDDQASVTFNVQNAQVREAVESAMPRLREMLADSGVQLQDANVSDQSAKQQEQVADEGGSSMRGQQLVDDDLDMAPQEVIETVIERSGLVDYYA